MPGRICLLRTSFGGAPEETNLVTSSGISVPHQIIDDMVTRIIDMSFNYRFVMPDEDVFCNKN